MDNYIAAFQEQNMLLNERDSSFIDVDGWLWEFWWANIFIPRWRHASRKGKVGTYLLPLRTLMDVDNFIMTEEDIAETLSLTRHQRQVEVPEEVQPLHQTWWMQ